MVYSTVQAFNPVYGQYSTSSSFTQKTPYALNNQSLSASGKKLHFGLRENSERSIEEKRNVRNSRLWLAAAIATAGIGGLGTWHENVHTPYRDSFIKATEPLGTGKKIPSYFHNGNFDKQEFSQAVREACETISTEKDYTLFCADIQMMLKERGLSNETARAYVKNIQNIQTVTDLQEFMNTLITQSSVTEEHRLALRDFKKDMKNFVKTVNGEDNVPPLFWSVSGGIVALIFAANSATLPGNDLVTLWGHLKQIPLRLKRQDEDTPPSK